MMPHTSTAAARRAAIVSIGIKWALVLLVILNLLQLNLLYFSSSGSTRCILKAALAMRARARSGEAAPPPAAPVLPGSPLGSFEQLGKPVATRLQRTRSGRYALFVIYAWNYEVLLTAVRSYVAAGFSKNLIILDNTDNSTLLGNPVIAELAAEVIPTRTRLTFSQAQNFMADVAIERGYEYYFWGHSDVAVLARDESASFADDVIACVESSFRSRPNWGIIYFNYDWFSAIRTDLVRQVKYDTFVTVYMSDCDFYPRVRAAGFETLNYPQMCPSTQVEVYDINQPFDIPWKDFDRAKAILDNHRDEGGNRFHWKMDVMSAGEKAGWDLWERSSYLYFLTKWGPRQEGQPPCKIEIKEPITGNMTLPQQPFGNLAYLQRFWVQEDPYFDQVPILAGLGRKAESWSEEAAAAPAPAVDESPEPAVSESPGPPSEDIVSVLPSGDDVEVVTESDNRVEQLQAAQLGLAAASQLRLAASEVLTQPDDSMLQESADAAKQDSFLASYDPLENEKLVAEPDQDLSGPDADEEREASDPDAKARRDGEPNQERQAAKAGTMAGEGSTGDDDPADGQKDLGKGTHASRDKAASADKAAVTYLEDDVAVSENAEDLYPEETGARLWGGLDQESANDAEERDSQAGKESADSKDAILAKASQGSLTAEQTQADRREGRSRRSGADAEQELDAEPEEATGDDKLLKSEDVDSPGQDDSYSNKYYSSRQQADDEDYDAEYAEQQDDAEYADEAEDAEYADLPDDDGLEQEYTDLPEGSEAEDTQPGSSAEAKDVKRTEATDGSSKPLRVKPGAQAKASSSRDAEVAEGEESAEPEIDLSRQQDDADEGDVATDEEAAAAEEPLWAGEVDVGPMPEEGLEDEVSHPADLGFDEMDLGDGFADEEWDLGDGFEDEEGSLQDAESEEEVDGGVEDLIEAAPLREGSADQ